MTTSKVPANGTYIRTIGDIGSMPSGTVGMVYRRNRKSVTIAANGGIATVPYGKFEIVTACTICGINTGGHTASCDNQTAPQARIYRDI